MSTGWVNLASFEPGLLDALLGGRSSKIDMKKSRQLQEQAIRVAVKGMSSRQNKLLKQELYTLTGKIVKEQREAGNALYELDNLKPPSNPELAEYLPQRQATGKESCAGECNVKPFKPDESSNPSKFQEAGVVAVTMIHE
ncbi:hypothetical protein RHS03_06369, partial [Rhizoctonia solani]